MRGAEIHVGYTQPMLDTTASGGADHIAGMPVALAAVIAAGCAVAAVITFRPVFAARLRARLRPRPGLDPA